MQSWKTILVIGSILACLVPNASPQTTPVAFSMNFSDVALDISGDELNYYASITINEESLFIFSGEITDNGSFVYQNSTDFSDNLQILAIKIYVNWEIENWTLQNDFSVSAFGMLNSSSYYQSGEMLLTWFGNESLLGRDWIIGEGDNESHFESAFFENGPDFDITLQFEGGNATNVSQVNYTVSATMVTWEFSNIVGGGGMGCTELTISNEGAANIDIDVQISGEGVTIFPANISVTLTAGASITVPVCVIADVLVGYSYRNVDVQATGQGSETNTHLNPQTKYASFKVYAGEHARLSIRADQPHQEVCQGKEFFLTFTVINYGNYVDTILIEVVNREALEEAGFIVALSQPLIEIDSQGEMQVPLNIRAGNATEIMEEGNYTLVVKASTTLAVETEAQNATVTLDILECGSDDGIQRIPAPSLAAAVAAVAVIALRRRR